MVVFQIIILALELGATLAAACDTSLMERVRRRQVLAPSDMTLGKWGATGVGICAAHPYPFKPSENVRRELLTPAQPTMLHPAPDAAGTMCQLGTRVRQQGYYR